MKAFTVYYSKAFAERLHDAGTLGINAQADAIRAVKKAHCIQLNAVGKEKRNGKDVYVFNFVAKDDELAEEIEGAFEALVIHEACEAIRDGLLRKDNEEE